MNLMAPDQAHRHSIERIDPGAMDTSHPSIRRTVDLHLDRYVFASRFARGLRVLDMACGVGYGSSLLATRGLAREVVGVDIDETAVQTARSSYLRPNIRYECRSAYDFTDPEPFDVAVSLETIEHLPDPEGFVAAVHVLLKPAGLFVASVPVTPSVDVNVHHRHDFSEASFRRLLKNAGFSPFDELRQRQPYSLFRLGWEIRNNVWGMDIRPNLPAYYLRNPRKAWARLWHLLRDGTVNKYLVVASRKAGRPPVME